MAVPAVSPLRQRNPRRAEHLNALIAGVGDKRAKELLEAFGSVQGVRFATTEQLAAVVGDRVAGKIREYFDAEDPAQETGEGAKE